jgi:hypothetical protein|nr:MAG TPA: hypothetical protein [Caudoviricetes sp.]
MILQLTKQSTDQEIKAYFEEVLRISRDSEEFPVNLDDVWPLVYSRKDKAVRALQSNDLFLQNVDYQVLPQNGENSMVLVQNGGKVQNGRPTEIYLLSVPCLEFFIARKVRPVFEVYRQVFHKVASGELMRPKAPAYSKPCDFETTIKPLTDYTDELMKRWDRLFDLSNESNKVVSLYKNWLTTYRNLCYYISQMEYLETMAKLDGKYYLQD